jgi:hypothetical protein
MFVVQQPHQMFETGVGSLLGNDVHQPLDFGCDGVTLKTLPMERRHVFFLRLFAIQVNHYARRKQSLLPLFETSSSEHHGELAQFYTPRCT